MPYIINEWRLELFIEDGMLFTSYLSHSINNQNFNLSQELRRARCCASQ